MSTSNLVNFQIYFCEPGVDIDTSRLVILFKNEKGNIVGFSSANLRRNSTFVPMYSSMAYRKMVTYEFDDSKANGCVLAEKDFNDYEKPPISVSFDISLFTSAIKEVDLLIVLKNSELRLFDNFFIRATNNQGKEMISNSTLTEGTPRTIKDFVAARLTRLPHPNDTKFSTSIGFIEVTDMDKRKYRVADQRINPLDGLFNIAFGFKYKLKELFRKWSS